MKSKIKQISGVPNDLKKWLNSLVLINESDDWKTHSDKKSWIMGQITRK